MKIIDYWVATYLSLFKKDERKELIASLFVLQYLWGMNIISILAFLSPIITKRWSMNFIPVAATIGILGVSIALWIRNRLEKRYIENYEHIEHISTRIPKVLAFIVLVFHLLATIWFFFLCFRSFRFLVR